jgi:hypothetical protein
VTGTTTPETWAALRAVAHPVTASPAKSHA